MQSAYLVKAEIEQFGEGFYKGDLTTRTVLSWKGLSGRLSRASPWMKTRLA